MGRWQVPLHTADELFVVKDDISAAVRAQLSERAARFGFEIVATLVNDIALDGEVRAAISHAATQARLRLAATDEAEAKKVKSVAWAEADAAATTVGAQADAVARQLHGEGLARQHVAILSGMAGMANEITGSIDGAEATEALRMMVMVQRLEMLTKTGEGSRTNALYLNHSVQSVGQIFRGVSGSAAIGEGVAPPAPTLAHIVRAYQAHQEAQPTGLIGTLQRWVTPRGLSMLGTPLPTPT